MSELNLNFDTGSKSISLGNTSGIDNIGFVPDSGNSQSPIKTIDLGPSPNLSVSDPSGFGILTKGKGPDPLPPHERPNEVKEEFSFFKSSEPEPATDPLGMGGIVNGGLPESSVNPDEAIFMNKEQAEEASEFRPIHHLTPQDIKNEKIDLLYKFKKLEGHGIRTTLNYNMNSQLDDMRNEYIKLKKQREVENSVKFQRKMLMACITGIEFLNGKFDPFNVKLDGWSESMNEGVNDYDEVFEELHEKYGGKAEVAPEIRLIFMVAGSAFMFHLTNTMFKTSLPGMDEVMKNNPELMQQFAKAAVNTPPSAERGGTPPQQNPMGGLMSGLMGGLMGGGGPMGGMMGGMGPPPKMPPRRSQQKPQQPDNVDDIINNMNINPDNIDLDSISIISSDNGGITLDI